MKTLIISFLISMLAISNSIAQNSKSVAGNSPTSNQFKLPDSVVKAIDSVFAEFDNSRSPGCAVGVVQGGKLIFARGYGMANLEHNVPIRPKTVFRIGSTSKQVTAGAIALLAQQNVLSLDDPVRKWIPELPDHGPRITLRKLLHHTSGIRDYLSLMDIAGYRAADWYSDDEVLKVLARQQALNFEAGTEHIYSNSGYFLLSEVVKRATGQTLAEYAEEHLFRPLDMENTHFHNDPTRVVPNRATGYSPTGDGGYRINVTTLPMIGDGGVFSTIEDMTLWAQNLVEPKVGGKEWQKAMFTPGRLNSGDTTDYALGLYYGEHRGLRTVGHGGSFVGYRADLTRFPDHELTVITLCNRSDASPASRSLKVAEAFLEDHMVPEKAPVSAKINKENSISLTPAMRNRYADTYWRFKDWGALLHISSGSDGLTINDVASSNTTSLIPISESTLRLEEGNARIIFESTASAEPQKAVWEGPNGSKTPLISVEAWDPDLNELREFVGLYYSPEVDTYYKIILEDDRLIARHHRRDDLPLTPAEKNGFGSAYPFMNVQFQRGENGQITGFLVSAGRVKDIRFEKQE